MAISKKCKCGKPRAPSSRYCNPCKAAYMREWRKSHPLTPEQRRRANARRTSQLVRRGALVKGLCEVCGSPEVEGHHDDYSKPKEVRWLCRQHHLEHHRA